MLKFLGAEWLLVAAESVSWVIEVPDTHIVGYKVRQLVRLLFIVLWVEVVRSDIVVPFVVRGRSGGDEGGGNWNDSHGN